MGIYFSTYIGCFLRLPNKTEPVIETFYKKPSGERTSTKFNPDTGEEYEQVSETKLKKVYANTYIEEAKNFKGVFEGGDVFYQPAYAGQTDDYIVALPNSGSNFDEEHGFNHSMGDVNIESKIIEFKKRYSAYLDYYIEQYGQIEVHYGVVHYGS